MTAPAAPLDPEVERRLEERRRQILEQRKKGNFVRREIRNGLFSRSFTLPESVDPGSVGADYKNGLLTVTLAKRIDGRLVLYVEHYLNPRYFPGILDFDLTRSLTELYASEYRIHYGRVRFDMVPTALHTEAASTLRTAPGSPALRITRLNRDQQDRLIDCDVEYWRHDAIHVCVEVPE